MVWYLVSMKLSLAFEIFLIIKLRKAYDLVI